MIDIFPNKYFFNKKFILTYIISLNHDKSIYFSDTYNSFKLYLKHFPFFEIKIFRILCINILITGLFIIIFRFIFYFSTTFQIYMLWLMTNFQLWILTKLCMIYMMIDKWQIYSFFNGNFLLFVRENIKELFVGS